MSRFRIDSTFKTFGAFWPYKQPDKKLTGSIKSRKGTVELESSPEYTKLDREAFRAISTEECPLSRRMFDHVEVNSPSRSDLDCDEYIEDTETSCYGNKEIAGYDAMGMIVEKGRGRLRPRSE